MMYFSNNDKGFQKVELVLPLQVHISQLIPTSSVKADSKYVKASSSSELVYSYFGHDVYDDRVGLFFFFFFLILIIRLKLFKASENNQGWLSFMAYHLL